jgi:parvulin-like peptidyl-prolyl isomerase
MFGEDFAAALEMQPDFEWRALQSERGWHLVRVDGKWPAEPARFDDVRDVVAADWEQAALADRAREALDDMMAGYRVSRPTPEPAQLSNEAAEGAAGG